MKSGKRLVALPVILGLALVSIWLLLTPLQLAQAAFITVDTTADEADADCFDGDCSLRDAIDTAAPWDTIEFDPALSGQTIVLSIGQLDIDRDLIIDGSSLPAHIQISGYNTYRVFHVYGNVFVSLTALDIIKGYAGDGYGGGGIYNESDLTLTDCHISANSTPDNGGGVRNIGALRVYSSTLANNSADYGGGIRNENSMNMTSTVFSQNTADWGGGIDNYFGNLIISGSAFYSNTASNGGGGITSGTDMTVISSTFESNAAVLGGAIENHNDAILSVTDSNFVSNTVTGAGGGLINFDGVVTLTDCIFTANDAYGGGGAANAAAMTMTGCSFSENTAAIDGGGLLNQDGSTTVITGSAFINNSAASTGAGFGGGIANYGSLSLDHSAFSRNSAQINGGAIDNWVGSLIITDTTFISNTALSGGGIDNNMTSTLRVTGSTFQENQASEGGGIYNDNSSILAINGSHFYTNTALNSGGASYNRLATQTVTGCLFSGNSADYGGAIRNDETMTVTLSAFQENSADFGGGIHSVAWGKLTVDRSILSANRSQYYGGGIFNGAVLTVTQSTLDHNLGRAGGGILNDGTAWVGNSTLSANSAIDYGGGVNNSSGVITLTHSTLEGNFAGVGGGGLSNGAILYLRNTLMAYSPSGGDCLNSGAINENTNSLAEDGGCGTAFSGDPHLEALADNGGPTWTCALHPDSSAIDDGAVALCLSADQRGEARDDWSCDIGAFELQLTDSHTVIKSIQGAGIYTFGPTRVKVEVTSRGSLNSLSVTQSSGDHPGHTGSSGGNGVGWGEYFIIDPNPGANNTFAAILSLPSLFTPDASDSVCRYLGGTSWDCAAHSFSGAPFNHVSRQGVTAFSDWAAGNDVSPTVVRLTSLQAVSAHPDVMLPLTLLAIAVLGAGYWVHLKKIGKADPARRNL